MIQCFQALHGGQLTAALVPKVRSAPPGRRRTGTRRTGNSTCAPSDRATNGQWRGAWPRLSAVRRTLGLVGPNPQRPAHPRPRSSPTSCRELYLNPMPKSFGSAPALWVRSLFMVSVAGLGSQRRDPCRQPTPMARGPRGRRGAQGAGKAKFRGRPSAPGRRRRRLSLSLSLSFFLARAGSFRVWLSGSAPPRQPAHLSPARRRVFGLRLWSRLPRKAPPLCKGGEELRVNPPPVKGEGMSRLDQRSVRT